MRTNIDLDDQLLEEARGLSGIKTKKDVVEQALRVFIQIQRQIKIRELRGKVQWDGNLDQIKEGRTYDIG
jgi:Arc/MetJ family transcription regulator